jgi:hypothetical protein
VRLLRLGEQGRRHDFHAGAHRRGNGYPVDEMALSAGRPRFLYRVSKRLDVLDQLLFAERGFADAVQKSRPAGAKGHFINRVAISSTMGPGVKVEPATLFPESQAH